MISVVVYAQDDERTIARCLESLTLQRGAPDFEVVVIDDCSADCTPEIVARRFPQFQLVRNVRALGWVRSLREHLPRFRGAVLASLGVHCRAHEDWLSAIQEEMARGAPVMTGRGYHGEGFLARFEAISVHPDYLGGQEKTTGFLWDDNFAVLLALLIQALPETDAVLSDGAGAFLLSRRLQDMGIAIAYRPAARIDHVTPSFGRFFEMWYNEMARNAVMMRRVDRSLPGARLLRLGPVAAGTFAAGRLLQGAQGMIRARRSLNISPLELGLHIGFLAFLMPAYFLGLCRQMLAGSRAGTQRACGS